MLVIFHKFFASTQDGEFSILAALFLGEKVLGTCQVGLVGRWDDVEAVAKRNVPVPSTHQTGGWMGTLVSLNVIGEEKSVPRQGTKPLSSSP
jgi:hypothetical protein